MSHNIIKFPARWIDKGWVKLDVQDVHDYNMECECLACVRESLFRLAGREDMDDGDLDPERGG